MPAQPHQDILTEIPDPDTIRRRLAEVLTEASLLRSQLRVSRRLERERERLQRPQPEEASHAS
jgi:hypothetical protein